MPIILSVLLLAVAAAGVVFTVATIFSADHAIRAVLDELAADDIEDMTRAGN